jgi:hypothetical protein
MFASLSEGRKEISSPPSRGAYPQKCFAVGAQYPRANFVWKILEVGCERFLKACSNGFNPEWLDQLNLLSSEVLYQVERMKEDCNGRLSKESINPPNSSQSG